MITCLPSHIVCRGCVLASPTLAYSTVGVCQHKGELIIAGPREARNPIRSADCVLRVRAMFITGMLKPEIEILFSN